MAGQLLDDKTVGTTGQQVGDAASSEIVRSKRFHSGFAGAFPQDVPDLLAAQTTKADAAGLVHVAEQRASARSAEPEPVFNGLPCPVWHVDESVLAAFASKDREVFTSCL